MRLFLKSIIYFIIPVILFGITAELLLRNIPTNYIFKKEYLDTKSNDIEVLVLGNSHSYYGVDPAHLKLKAFNAANLVQWINYDSEILKKYSQSLTKLKWIILPISYPSLDARLESSLEPWRAFYYISYFDLNIPHKITDYSLLLNNNFRFNLNRIYGYYFFKINEPSFSELGWAQGEPGTKQDLYESGILEAKRETSKGVHDDHNLGIMKSIISYAKERNIKVLLVTTPAFHAYVENLDSLQLNRAINAALDLEKEYPNVKYMNFLTDSSFTEKDFHDAIHLDISGAPKLTLKLDSIITSIENTK